MYTVTYAISAHSSKQWPLQCWEQFSSWPFISRRRGGSACKNRLSSPKEDLICSATCRGVTLQHGTWHEWAQLCRKGRHMAFPALHFPSPSRLGISATLPPSDKLSGNLLYSTLSQPETKYFPTSCWKTNFPLSLRALNLELKAQS